jgi:acyl-coenzyme A synthetase/AMP-(fatty) acid ligase
MTPKTITILAEMPKNAVGKILRSQVALACQTAIPVSP